MGRRPDFAQLLDEALRDTAAAAAPSVNRPSPSVQPVPPHPFLFTAPYRIVRPAPAETRMGRVADASGGRLMDRNRPPQPRVRPAQGNRPVWADAAPVAPPTRGLTAGEREALAAFNGLGAGLSPNFTARELRTAYRALARRLHPDANGSADAADRAQRARLFVTATAHHQTLLNVFPREAQRAA